MYLQHRVNDMGNSLKANTLFFFPNFVSTQNMVRVINGKIFIKKWSEGKQKLLWFSGSFELPYSNMYGGIGHFRVPKGLCIKTRSSARPLMWKLFFILMQIKLIFKGKVVHLASFLKVRVFGTWKSPIDFGWI